MAKLLEDSSNQELDSVAMSQKIIEALDSQREKTARWAAVGRMTIEETSEYEGSEGLFVVGPFRTQLQAQRAGVNLVHDARWWSSKGEYMSVPILGTAQGAWEAMKPKHKDKYAHIREAIKEQEIAMFGKDWFAERRGW